MADGTLHATNWDQDAVFAKVKESLTRWLQGRKYNQANIDHVMKTVDEVAHHEAFKGQDWVAIEHGFKRAIEPRKGAVTEHINDLTKHITGEKLIGSVPNTTPPPVSAKSEAIKMERVEKLKKRAHSWKPNQAEEKVAGGFTSLSNEAKIGIGVSSLIAGISLISGVQTLATGFAKDDLGQSHFNPGAVAWGAAQILIGAGIAALTHSNYKSAIAR